MSQRQPDFTRLAEQYVLALSSLLPHLEKPAKLVKNVQVGFRRYLITASPDYALSDYLGMKCQMF
jgi:hypothetical protein